MHLEKAILDDLAKWYWTAARLRTGRHAIDRSDWLFALYNLRQSASTLLNANGKKKTLALWGPSQVGKSTLLARYLDHGAENDGNNSILQWEENSPVRFENSGGHQNVTSINPYNFRADASACISRFSLQESVQVASCPVEIKLGSRTDLARALSTGYISDWNRDRSLILTDSAVREITDSLTKSNPINPEASYQQVFEVASLVLHFSTSSIQDNPFSGLSGASVSAILNCSPIATGIVNAGIYGRILWGGDPSITLLFHDLLEFRDKVAAIGNGEIRCCYKTAAMLLDMASYANATGGIDIEGRVIEPSVTLQQAILSVGYTLEGDAILLQLGNGTPLFKDVREFALFQGLIWELLFSVRKSAVIRHGGELHTFAQLLEDFDVLDFPGVSNIGTGSQYLDSSVLDQKGDHLLFTHLLKLGKTSAIISATAKEQIIDTFCLLMRTMHPLSRPGVIADGIKNWRKSLGEELHPDLHVLSTFFAGFVNDVIKNPDADHFARAFDPVKALGPAIQGATFHPILFAKYELLTGPNGTPVPPNEILPLVEQTAKRLTAHTEFNSIFNISSSELTDAIRQGGTNRLFRTVLKAGMGSHEVIVARLSKRLQSDLKSLLDPILPANSGNVDIKLLQDWIMRINASVQTSGYFDVMACQRVATGIRQLLSFTPDSLPPIPKNLRDSPASAVSFIEDILSQWQERVIENHVLLAAQIKNPVEKTRLLHAFAQRISSRDSARWLIEHFGKVTNDTSAKNARRFLAMYLTNLVNPRIEYMAPVDPYGKLIEYAAAETDPLGADPSVSPEFQSIISPLKTLVEKAQRVTVTSGEPQPGDQEIVEIAQRYYGN